MHWNCYSCFSILKWPEPPSHPILKDLGWKKHCEIVILSLNMSREKFFFFEFFWLQLHLPLWLRNFRNMAIHWVGHRIPNCVCCYIELWLWSNDGSAFWTTLGWRWRVEVNLENFENFSLGEKEKFHLIFGEKEKFRNSVLMGCPNSLEAGPGFLCWPSRKCNTLRRPLISIPNCLNLKKL